VTFVSPVRPARFTSKTQASRPRLLVRVVFSTVPGTRCRNPAFDVTPARMVSALVTERGVASPVDFESVAALLAR